MAYRRKTFKRSYKKKAYKRKSYARKTKKMSSVKRIVKREIARQAENKHYDIVVGPSGTVGGRDIVSATNTTFFDDNNIIKLSPASTDGAFPAMAITQGVGSSNRIGDRIKIKKAMFRGTLIQNTYDAIKYPLLKPTQVKMFLFYNRQQPALKPAVQAAGDFFQANNTTLIIQDDLASLWLTPNNDKYRVLTTKMFKVGRAANAQSATGVLGPTNYWNNDFSMNCNFSMDVTKYMPTDIRYRDTDQDPSTRGLYAMFVPVAADGTGFGAGAFPINLTYSIAYEFEDA